mgnify:CR=1 FL=1
MRDEHDAVDIGDAQRARRASRRWFPPGSPRVCRCGSATATHRSARVRCVVRHHAAERILAERVGGDQHAACHEKDRCVVANGRVPI